MRELAMAKTFTNELAAARSSSLLQAGNVKHAWESIERRQYNSGSSTLRSFSRSG
jgi:hypothetical protein